MDWPLKCGMGATDGLVWIGRRHRPDADGLVPERREERTTEGGLDAAGAQDHLQRFVSRLTAAGSRVSLFIEPDPTQLEAAVRLGAPVVAMHTGACCDATLEDPDGERPKYDLARICKAATRAAELGLDCKAGNS